MLYSCETWSLTLEGERRERVFENGILWRILEPKRDDEREWKRFYYGKLRNLYHPRNIFG